MICVYRLTLIWILNLMLISAVLGHWKQFVRHPPKTMPANRCPVPSVVCDAKQRFRTFDGTCNNLKSPALGAANVALRRSGNNAYDDGVQKPRYRDKHGDELPSTRTVSTVLLETEISEPERTIITNLFQVFGQFIDHDMSFTPNEPMGTEICCTPELNAYGGQSEDLSTGGSCFTIENPPNDPRFPSRCMNFVRSREVMDSKFKCGSTNREQINVITSFIDASMTYGSSKATNDKLRTFVNGSMVYGPHQLLPENSNTGCTKLESDHYCFLSGDARVNEHPGLGAFHSLWHRFHNELVRYLHVSNPHWDDARLFEEGRRIVGAVTQHITYDEFLPPLIGNTEIYKYRLRPLQYKYNSKIDPSIFNSFSTAAFRYGHSSIPNEWTYGMGKITLVEMFFSSFFVQNNNGTGLDKMLQGMLIDSSQDSDPTFSDGVHNKLFATATSLGGDLAAINMQRGRDHGLPPYNAYRKWCGLPLLKSFSGRAGHILRQIYKHPDDVDLFMGGLTELKVPGGEVGPTFACIIGRQFHNLKYGDRYWYENHRPVATDPTSGFTPAQLQSIYGMKMGRLLCDYSNIQSSPRLAFLHPSNGPKNAVISCNDFPKLDLSLWQEY